ncbi:hypothetical protein T484DRAFT_1638167 [Baffinella frigidus]|nr:hypothetical protein T484DRAFT_1638167 [Cryptophyta sp. CCMP2293]
MWNPKPETRNPKPETRNPKPETRNPKPQTQNPKPKTQKPKPQTPNPKPQTSNRRTDGGAGSIMAVKPLGHFRAGPVGRRQKWRTRRGKSTCETSTPYDFGKCYIFNVFLWCLD